MFYLCELNLPTVPRLVENMSVVVQAEEIELSNKKSLATLIKINCFASVL